MDYLLWILVVFGFVAMIAHAFPAKGMKTEKPKAELAQSLKQTFEAYCLPYDQMKGVLSDRWQEGLKSSGRTDAGAIAEFWASRGGQTWTWLIVLQNGIACAVASGGVWLKK